MRLPLTKTAGLNVVDVADVVWRKAKRSHDTGDCVEVVSVGGRRLVRDSKTPAKGVLDFDPAVWGTFVGRIVRGEFDL